MSLLNKGPSNSDFADGPLLCVECPLRACVRISYMRARARFLVWLNCYMNYLFLSFFRVGRAFFKVVILFELYSFASLTLKTLLQMAKSKLPRNVFVVRYRPYKCKKSVVFGTYALLKYALHTMPFVMDWYDADVFDIEYIDPLGCPYLVFHWDCTVYGDK